MWVGTVTTDFNGLALFEPTLLARFHGDIAHGADLFGRYRSTDEGDQVLTRGIVVPVVAIDDAAYLVCVRTTSEPWQAPGEVVVLNGVFPVHVADRLVLADLVVLKEWLPEVGWFDVCVAPGFYSATVRGFVSRDLHGHIQTAGYEFLLQPTLALPDLSASLGRNMRVLQDSPLDDADYTPKTT